MKIVWVFWTHTQQEKKRTSDEPLRTACLLYCTCRCVCLWGLLCVSLDDFRFLFFYFRHNSPKKSPPPPFYFLFLYLISSYLLVCVCVCVFTVHGCRWRPTFRQNRKGSSKSHGVWYWPWLCYISAIYFFSLWH
jgi:hypothetical protein